MHRTLHQYADRARANQRNLGRWVYAFAAKNPPIPMRLMGGNLPAYPKSNIAMNAGGNGSSIGCGFGDKP